MIEGRSFCRGDVESYTLDLLTSFEICDHTGWESFLDTNLSDPRTLDLHSFSLDSLEDYGYASQKTRWRRSLAHKVQMRLGASPRSWDQRMGREEGTRDV